MLNKVKNIKLHSMAAIVKGYTPKVYNRYFSDRDRFLYVKV